METMSNGVLSSKDGRAAALAGAGTIRPGTRYAVAGGPIALMSNVKVPEIL